MIHKRKTAILLTICLMTTAAGCGNRETQEFTSEGIELIEPVNTASNTEEAAYRNLYDYRTTVGNIYPYIQEYALSVDAPFGEYAVLPGDTVKKGSLLLTADEASLQEEIEILQKSMEDAAYAYEEEQSGYEESIADINEALEELNERIADLEETRSKIANWYEDYNRTLLKTIGNIKLQAEACEMRIAQIRLKAQHATELYELDTDYNNRLLERLREKGAAYRLYSGMDGTVISADNLWPGQWLRADTPIVAVGDETQKILRCSYLTKYDVERCEDIYAVINGERYEVTYQPYTKLEYDKLYEKYNGAVYSSFVIDDPEGKVKIGDFAILTQVYSRGEHVLSVAKNALHWDETGYYVYRMEDGESVLTHVRLGISDGVYTEITSGLSEHDVVLLTDSQPYGSGTATLARGTFSNSLDFSRKGYGTHQSMGVIRNPVKHGTVHVLEYCLSVGDRVKKGDLVAKIRVEGDEIALYEKRLALQRLSERLAEVVDRRDERQRKYDSEYDEAKKKELEKEIRALNKEIERRQRVIDEQTEEVAELERYYATTEIYADQDGLVVWCQSLDPYFNPNASEPIEPDEALVYVTKNEFCFVRVEDEYKQLPLGTTVNVEYRSNFGFGDVVTVQGVVVVSTAPSNIAGISPELESQSAYIGFPREVAMQLYIFLYGISGIAMQYDVTAAARSIDGVLLVPKSAVWEAAGKTYVFIRQEDGTVRAQSFIAGGSNADSYWVIEGLEEGMKICAE